VARLTDKDIRMKETVTQMEIIVLLITSVQANKCVINLKHGDYIHKTNAKPTFHELDVTHSPC